jgi:hypothetical protein
VQINRIRAGLSRAVGVTRPKAIFFLRFLRLFAAIPFEFFAAADAKAQRAPR